MKIGIGNDHTGVQLKNELIQYLTNKGYQVINFGTDQLESYPYPKAGEILANAVINHEVDCAIAICGTGVGISLAANKVKGIRCACVSEAYSASMAKQHNNAQMIAFGARVVGSEVAKMIVDAWLEAEFLGDRHATRVQMITDIEEKGSY